MMNKRGTAFKVLFWIGALIIVVSLLFYLFSGLNIQEKFPEFQDADYENAESFGEVTGIGSLSFLDFIFGKIPQYLIGWTNGISALIIVLGIWIMLLLTFGDIISMFGTFSQWVSWVIALVLVVIAANLKFITVIMVTSLIITSALGAFAVAVSMIMVFVVFLLFNFGTSKFRTWIIHRRIQEAQLRAATGGARAKAALSELIKMGKELEEGGSS